MKSWFGVLGRACLEFLLILSLAALVSGAASSLAATNPRGGLLLAFALAALPRLLPLAAAAAIFLAMFSFEHRVASRAAGWLGLLLLGIILLSAGLAPRLLPGLQRLLPEAPTSFEAALQPPGVGVDRDGLLLWYRQPGDGGDAVLVDFREPYPRLSHQAGILLDAAKLTIRAGGSSYGAAAARLRAEPLFPEAALLPGPPIWERYAELGALPLPASLALLGGFVLLATGFRFLTRLSRWPLANALFAVSGFLAFLALDAAFASPALAALAAALLPRSGGAMPALLVPAAAEGLLGLLLGAADLAIRTRERPSRG
ncbi:MAG TPA: hypothetical protein PLB91_00995 [Spirochaetales bacterium]|nr:hypothetical protein [Spirochaetales bacterium]HRY54155.1 hypothetical protein [Spirochaetia bacterium]HRZ65184.1 hypothetical protein [Spirochaetia bacterium]